MIESGIRWHPCGNTSAMLTPNREPFRRAIALHLQVGNASVYHPRILGLQKRDTKGLPGGDRLLTAGVRAGERPRPAAGPPESAGPAAARTAGTAGRDGDRR